MKRNKILLTFQEEDFRSSDLQGNVLCFSHVSLSLLTLFSRALCEFFFISRLYMCVCVKYMAIYLTLQTAPSPYNRDILIIE